MVNVLDKKETYNATILKFPKRRTTDGTIFYTKVQPKWLIKTSGYHTFTYPYAILNMGNNPMIPKNDS